jgi:hypothetical protein
MRSRGIRPRQRGRRFASRQVDGQPGKLGWIARALGMLCHEAYRTHKWRRVKVGNTSNGPTTIWKASRWRGRPTPMRVDAHVALGPGAAARLDRIILAVCGPAAQRRKGSARLMPNQRARIPRADARPAKPPAAKRSCRAGSNSPRRWVGAGANENFLKSRGEGPRRHPHSLHCFRLCHDPSERSRKSSPFVPQ